VWRVAIGALIAGLCLAAAAAITALVGGDVDDTHARVIASSLGFGVFSALGAAGAELWRDARGWRRGIGGANTAAAFLAYALLIAALWLSNDEDAAWSAFGIAGLPALCGSHASLVLRARRRDDAPLVAALVWISIVGGAFDMLVPRGGVPTLGVLRLVRAAASSDFEACEPSRSAAAWRRPK
jgi:hypothetical protein